MAEAKDGVGKRWRLNRAKPGASGDNAGVLRKLASVFRKRAAEQGVPVVVVQSTDGTDEAVRKIEGLLSARTTRPSGGPLIVEVPPRRRPPRVRRPALAGQDEMHADAEAVRKAERMWQERRKCVDALEKAARDWPLETLRYHTEFAHERLLDAGRILSERFGVDITGTSRYLAGQLVVDDPSVDLDDAGEVAAYCDAMWSFLTFEDVRVAINRVIAQARHRDEEDEKTAQAACCAVTHVLRSRPMLYGVFALRPDFLAGREASGLAEARKAALILLAGWVRANLKLSDWRVKKRGPGGTVITTFAPNRLREALLELAGEGESHHEVFFRELPAATFDELCRLLSVAEADPSKARTKKSQNSLRNEVAKRFTRMISEEGRLRRKGRHVAEEEADAERALTAHQETVVEDTEREALDALEATAALSPQQKQIIELVLVGKENPEIAAALGTTRGTVEKQKSEAFRRLREAKEAAGY